MATQTTAPPIRTIEDIDGWFSLTDQLVMDWLLGHQERVGVRGDLLEMGAYLGKSTVLLGFHRRDGERVVVCDLFGEEAPTEENQRTAAWYEGRLTREAFEANYAAFHRAPPEVLQAPTTVVPDHVPADSCRFLHIDACHLYDVVREDIRTAQNVLSDQGIVVFDDIRSAHTPGVAAAVWPEVAGGDLEAICLTPNKLYATWGEADPVQDAMLDWLGAYEGARFELQQIAGRRLVRLAAWDAPPPSPVPAALGMHAPRRPPLSTRAKEVAADLIPPLVTRAVRKRKQRTN